MQCANREKLAINLVEFESGITCRRGGNNKRLPCTYLKRIRIWGVRSRSEKMYLRYDIVFEFNAHNLVDRADADCNFGPSYNSSQKRYYRSRVTRGMIGIDSAPRIWGSGFPIRRTSGSDHPAHIAVRRRGSGGRNWK